MAAIIVTNNLTKEYEGVFALREMNLTIGAGERFALVGDAKSGKTTLMRLLSGLSSPSSGDCTVMGLNPAVEAAKEHSRLGAVLETAKLYENLTANENLLHFASVQGIDKNDALDRISFLLHYLEIWEYRDMRTARIPTSAHQKLMLAKALLHSPRLLLLDEPTDGMNYETTLAVKKMIDYIAKEENTTVVLSTRHQNHAELICDTFAIMDAGEIIARGNKASLLEKSGLKHRALLKISDECDPPPEFNLTADGRWGKEISSEDEMPALIQKAAESCEIIEATVETPSLKDIYNAFTSGEYMQVPETEEDFDDDIISEGESIVGAEEFAQKAYTDVAYTGVTGDEDTAEPQDAEEDLGL